MSRKRKADVLFQKEWIANYLMYERSYGCECMLCGSQFSIIRDNSLLERHFAIAHVNFNKSFPPGSKERAAEIKRLLEKCAEQKSPPSKQSARGPPKNKKSNKNSEPTNIEEKIVRDDNQTIAKVTEKIASILQNNVDSTVEDGELLKTILVDCASDLLKDSEIKKKFIATLENVPIAELHKKNEVPNVETANTYIPSKTSKLLIAKPPIIDLVNCTKYVYKPIHVTKPQPNSVAYVEIPPPQKNTPPTIQALTPAKNVTKKISDCNWYSLMLDGSKGKKICNLILYARLVYDNHCVEEKFLRTEPLQKNANAADILKIVCDSLKSVHLPLSKLVGFTLNPCWPFCDEFILEYTNNNNMPDVCCYICIVTEVMNCLKLMTMESMHKGIEKILSYLTTNKQKLPVLHSKIVEALKASLTDNNKNYYLPSDKAKWLRYKTILSELVEVVLELKSMEDENLTRITELQDPKWLLDLSFLADFISEFNIFLKEIRASKLTIWQHVTLLKEFRDKLEIWIFAFQSNQISTSFPKLRDIVLKNNQEIKGDQYAILLREVLTEVENIIARYPDVNTFIDYSRDLFHLPKDKMDDLVKSLKSKSSVESTELFNEIIKLKNDSKLFLVAKCGGNIWDNIKDYPKINEVYQRLLSVFGTAHLKYN